MPLHLLGKKSWNVYNPANIERVRRDEDHAKAQEQLRERLAQDEEAEDRLSTLRGMKAENSSSIIQELQPRGKKRKLPGEDDTDRDLRLARTAVDAQPARQRKSDYDLTDKKGNIALFQELDDTPRSKTSQVAESPFTTYLHHASGKHQNADKPWYSQLSAQGFQESDKLKWGDDNPRRRQREASRIDAADPLAAMKKGVRQLRESEQHRKEWIELRERDLKEVEDMGRKERRRDKRKRRKETSRHEEDDLNSIEDFKLDEDTSLRAGQADRRFRSSDSGERRYHSPSDHDKHRRESRRHHRHQRST